jgi:hypothetical protein
LFFSEASLRDEGPTLGVRFKAEVNKAKGTGTEHESERGREISFSLRERNKKLWMIIASHLLSAPSLSLRGNGDGDGEVEVDQSESSDEEERRRTDQTRSVLALLEGTQTIH